MTRIYLLLPLPMSSSQCITSVLSVACMLCSFPRVAFPLNDSNSSSILLEYLIVMKDSVASYSLVTYLYQ